MKFNSTFIVSLTLLAFIFSTLQVSGQAKMRKQGDQLFLHENYGKALEYYNFYNKTEKRPFTLLRKGICEYQLGNYQTCISDMTKVLDMEKSMEEPYYYLGLCHIDLGKYEQAAILFKEYLNKSSKMDQQREKEVLDIIKRCEYGTRLTFANQYAYIENMGTSVNSIYNELSPAQSPNFQNKYYFSSDRDIAAGGKRDDKGLKNEFLGKYYYDMFAVELKNGNWTSVYPFNTFQNTSRNEIIQDFSKSGDAMFYIKKGNKDGGQLLVDTFSLTAEERIFPTQYNVPIHAEIGDKDISIFKDNIILFSSKRDGGYGGYDLYITQLVDDTWMEPFNLGPNINTSYDEVSGYITKGGNELYFSSDRPESLGGFDIFKVEYLNNKWSTAINLGVPINSSRDDKDMFVSFDGTQAVFSSNRPNGLGGYDLYLAYWKTQVLDQLAYTEELAFVVLPDTSTVDSSGIINLVAKLEQPISQEKKEFINTPLYYDPNGDLLAPQNLVTLKTLADFNKVYPNMKLKLIAHTSSDNLKEFNLFFGIKRAEKIKEYLSTKGYKPQDIEVLSAGNSYPILESQNSVVALKYHNRIDIQIDNSHTEYLTIIDEFPSINSELKSTRFQKYLADLNGLTYRIKIGETSQMLRGDILLKDQIFLAKKEGDKLSYYIGSFSTYNQAKDLKIQLSQSNLTDILEITPFIDFNQLSDINPYLGTYPDLELFKQFGK